MRTRKKLQSKVLLALLQKILLLHNEIKTFVKHNLNFQKEIVSNFCCIDDVKHEKYLINKFSCDFIQTLAPFCRISVKKRQMRNPIDRDRKSKARLSSSVEKCQTGFC